MKNTNVLIMKKVNRQSLLLECLVVNESNDYRHYDEVDQISKEQLEDIVVEDRNLKIVLILISLSGQQCDVRIHSSLSGNFANRVQFGFKEIAFQMGLEKYRAQAVFTHAHLAERVSRCEMISHRRAAIVELLFDFCNDDIRHSCVACRHALNFEVEIEGNAFRLIGD